MTKIVKFHCLLSIEMTDDLIPVGDSQFEEFCTRMESKIEQVLESMDSIHQAEAIIEEF